MIFVQLDGCTTGETLPGQNLFRDTLNNSALGCESASTKMNQSPLAAAAPEFRARAIWLTGSNTTSAPAA